MMSAAKEKNGRTVHEVSALTGVSVRTLHHYDAIGLLKPTCVTEAGYRLYGDAALSRLQQILLFRELEFPLRDIAAILDRPEYCPEDALTQQIRLLELRRDRLGELIALARQIKETGMHHMDFTAFDKTELETYAEEAKKRWGQTNAYREYETKSHGRSDARQKELTMELMHFFTKLGALRELPPDGAEALAWVGELRAFLTAHYYTCTPEILSGLGQMYAAGGSMTDNIDRAGGAGTAAFAARAIEAYCAALPKD